MYAIIRSGGKQYTVRAGDTLRVEKLPREIGSEFFVEDILLVGGDKVHVGEPIVKNAKVSVVVTQQAKAPKVIVFKKKRRQGYRRLQGHRQLFTELFVKSIHSPSGEVSEAESTATVIDPAKKIERQAKFKAAEKSSATPKKKAVIKKAAPKKAAAPKKKSAAKKAVKKKAPAKKKAAKAKA